MGKLTLQFWLIKSCIAKEWRFHLQVSVTICCLLPLLVTLVLLLGGMIEAENGLKTLAVTIISLLSMSTALIYCMSRIISRNVKSTVGEIYSFKIMGITESEILSLVAIESVVTSASGVLLAVAAINILEWHFVTASLGRFLTLLQISFTITDRFGVGRAAIIILIVSMVILAWRASQYKKVGVIG